MSGIYPAVIKIVVLGLVRREFRQGSRVSMSRSLTVLQGSLSWSYRTCLVFILDVSGMDDQRPTASFSKVVRVGSSDMRREFRHLTNLNLVTCFSKLLRVGGSDLGQEFRWSEVPAFFGSSDASQLHCNLVTVGAV